MKEIFVFGSNLAGRHGKGAALSARYEYGAVLGEGVGRTGDAYAIPTKDEKLATLELDVIGGYIKDFLDYASANPDLLFLLTPIGTGLAGHKKADIWRILKDCGVPKNVRLAPSWVNDL